MIYAKKLPTGELVNISLREQSTWDDGSVDVPLDAMPDGFGPFAYDEANRAAVQSDLHRRSAEKAEAKKLLASKDPTSRATRAGLRAIRNVLREKINEIVAAGKSGDWSKVKPLPNLTAEQESALFGSEVDSE